MSTSVPHRLAVVFYFIISCLLEIHTLYLHKTYLRVLGQEDRVIRKQVIRFLLYLDRVQVPKEDTFKEGGNSLLSLTCKTFHYLTPVFISSLTYALVSHVCALGSNRICSYWIPASKSSSPCCFCLLYFSYLKTQALIYTVMENYSSFKILVTFYPVCHLLVFIPQSPMLPT